MDLLAMKRKDLQALCKQHGIKANLKNSEMAEKLSALLLKEDEKDESDDEQLEEEATETTAVDLVESPKLKRVKFSPDNETFYFVATDKEDSDSDCKYSPKTRKPIGGRRNPRRGENKTEEVVEVIEIKDTPVRVTRLSRKQQNMVNPGDVGNADGRGVKRGKVETECEVIALRKGKVVVKNEPSKRIVDKESHVKTALVDKVVIPEPVKRRSQRRTTLVSGISEAVETGKVGREAVNGKGAVKRGRVSTRNVGRKVAAEIGDDVAAPAVEMDEVMKENQEPSLLEESSLVVEGDVIKPQHDSTRCLNKAALTELSVPAEKNSPVEEPKVNVGFKVDEPAGSGTESDSCSKIEVVESSRKKRKGSSKKSEADTKDQLVTSAYSDFGKTTDISACLNENQPVEFVNFQAATLVHTEQNTVQSVETENIIENENIISETVTVVVENALHIADGPGGMEVINENIVDDEVVQQKLMCSNSDGWTDPQRFVDDVSCEMVDEVQDIGIQESEEEANTEHSKKTEEVNDVPNTGSLANCDSSETSLPEHETVVDIPTDYPVTASDLEHKALESEAASPIMYNSETNRDFGDGLTSGLKKSGPGISKGNLKDKHIEDARECDDTSEENPSVSPCQTFLKDFYEGSKTEDSVIVKSISGNGAVPEDQLASGVIAGVMEDPKLIDQIVMVDVEMDSEMPTADAAEAIRENQLDKAVPCDATLTQLDSSPADKGEDPERMNLHVLVGKTAKTDGSGNDSCIEHKALESEAASPIMNNSVTDRVFRDDLTSGLHESGLAISEGNSKGKHIEDVRECDETFEENPEESPCQTFNLKYFNEGSKPEDSEIVKSISGKGAAPDDQFSSDFIAAVVEDDKLKDQIVMVEVEMDSEIPTADAIEAVEENQLDRAVPGDATLTRLDSSPTDQGEKVNESLGTGICGPDEENYILNSIETEEMLEPNNIGSLMTCSAGSTKSSMLTPKMGDLFPDTASNHGKYLLHEEKEAVGFKNVSPILNSFGMKGLFRDDQTTGFKKLDLEMSISDSTIKFSDGMENAEEQTDNLQEVIEELLHQEHVMMGQVVEPKFTQEMSNQCQTGSAVMETNTCKWEDSEVKPCNHDTYARPQKYSGGGIASVFNDFPSLGDLCGLKGLEGVSEAGAENAKEQESAHACLVSQPADDMKLSEGLEACTTSCTVNQIADENSLPTTCTVSPEVVKSLETNMSVEVAGFELRSNERASSKDFNLNDQSNCNAGNILAYGNEENNAVTDIVRTALTEADSGIKNITDGVKSVEKTVQRLDGDSLPGERNSSYVKSFSDISRIRTEYDSPLTLQDVSLSCDGFDKRRLFVQEGFDSIGLKFKYSIKDGGSGTPVARTRQEINTSENVASPLVNNLGMEWLFGAEAHNLDAEMSNVITSSENFEKGIEVEKLNSSQDSELNSIKGGSLEADTKRSTVIYTTPLRKKNQPNNLVVMSDMKENFNARKSGLVKNISSAQPLHNRRALEDLQNK